MPLNAADNLSISLLTVWSTMRTTFGSARLSVLDCSGNAHLNVECDGLAIDCYVGCKGHCAVLALFICSPVEQDSESAFHLIVVLMSFTCFMTHLAYRKSIGKPQTESLLTPITVTTFTPPTPGRGEWGRFVRVLLQTKKQPFWTASSLERKTRPSTLRPVAISQMPHTLPE